MSELEPDVVGILWAELSWVDRSDPCWVLDEDEQLVADIRRIWDTTRALHMGLPENWAPWPDKWGYAEQLERWERSVLAVLSLVSGVSVDVVLSELLRLLGSTWAKSEKNWTAFSGYGTEMQGAFKPVEPHPDRLVARGWSGFEVWGLWLQAWSKKTRGELWVWKPKQVLDWVKWPQELREGRVIVQGDEKVAGEVREWWGVVDQGVLYARDGALLDVGLVDVLVPSTDVGLRGEGSGWW